MIRLIIATISIIAAIAALFMGAHPAWSIGLGLIGLVFIAWKCVSMEENYELT